MAYLFASKKSIHDKFENSQFFRLPLEDDFDGWVILGKNENATLFASSKDEFEKISIDLVEMYIPGFKNIETTDGSDIYIHNKELGELKKVVQNEKTSNATTRSYPTNQGNIKSNFFQIIWYLKHQFYFDGILILIGILVSFKFFLLGIPFFYWAYKRIKTQYKDISKFFILGDTVPGEIVNLNPTRIAVFTNMAKYGQYYPFIFIGEYKFKRLNSRKKLKVGDRVPMVTMYDNQNKEENTPFWDFINPFPIEFAIEDKNMIAKKIYSIPILDWNILSDNLKKLNHNGEPGSFKLKIKNSKW